MVSVSVSYLFHKPMDEQIKTWTLRFPAKENTTCNMEKASFEWPIVLPYDVKVRYRLTSRKFFGHEVSVLDFQKKILGPTGPQVFIFGRQNKYSSRQKLYLRTNGIK